MAKQIGDNTRIEGRDYKAITARLIQSTYKNAEDGEQAIYLRQGDQGISISKESLKAILDWLEQ